MSPIDQFRKDIDEYYPDYGFVAEIFLEKYTQELNFSSFQEAVEVARHIFENPEIYPKGVREIVTQEVCDSVAYAIENLILATAADKGVHLRKAQNQKKFIGHKLDMKTDFVLFLTEKWDFEIGQKHFFLKYESELPTKNVNCPDALAAIIAYIVKQTEEACLSFFENDRSKLDEKLDTHDSGYLVQIETFKKWGGKNNV